MHRNHLSGTSRQTEWHRARQYILQFFFKVRNLSSKRGRFEDNLLYFHELSSIPARLRIFCRLSLADEVQAVAEREDNSDFCVFCLYAGHRDHGVVSCQEQTVFLGDPYVDSPTGAMLMEKVAVRYRNGSGALLLQLCKQSSGSISVRPRGSCISMAQLLCSSSVKRYILRSMQL